MFAAQILGQMDDPSEDTEKETNQAGFGGWLAKRAHMIKQIGRRDDDEHD
jgi:hypothetical protein